MSPIRGILLKLASTLVFAGMVASIKVVGDRVPPGQVVFFRSFFALPVLLVVGWQDGLANGFATRRPFAHMLRSFYGVTSMFMWFAALQLLPVADALAISYAAPLLTVALAGVLLGETVPLQRWIAVAFGFAGVLVMLTPHLGGFGRLGSDTAAKGALIALASTIFVALAGTQVRRLTRTERTGAIVIWFTIGCTLFSFTTIPFGWVLPSGFDFACLVAAGLFGGVGQLMMTQAYRLADASVIAPLEYASMLWAVVYGFWLFGEVPGATVVVGSAVVIGAGVSIVMREHSAAARARHTPADPEANS
ncbi:DMT family transporter [Prosthecomicrobium sp. N25]|uniref:DMT family transporter n=1 Tax=Prosthecomicrobium sp. N25 TaxID=3129254 RepID=UPI00307711E1